MDTFKENTDNKITDTKIEGLYTFEALSNGSSSNGPRPKSHTAILINPIVVDTFLSVIVCVLGHSQFLVYKTGDSFWWSGQLYLTLSLRNLTKTSAPGGRGGGVMYKGKLCTSKSPIE